jgi:hypothetical protein
MLELQIVVPYRMHWYFQNYVHIVLLKTPYNRLDMPWL